MLKSLVVIAALAFAAPGLAIADDHKPPSFTDLTANDPPADTFHDPPGLPPGLGGSVPPGCSVLAADKDDRNGPNGDDKNPSHGNQHCQPASP